MPLFKRRSFLSKLSSCFSCGDELRVPTGQQQRGRFAADAADECYDDLEVCDTRQLFVCSTLPIKLRHRCWGLKDFHIFKEVHSDGVETVYQAFCEALGETVALKVYSPDANETLEIYQDVKSRTSGLQHSNMLTLYVAFEEKGKLYVAEEYAAGGNLESILARHKGMLSERKAVERVLQPLLQALAYVQAHGYKVVNVQPRSILFTDTGVLKISSYTCTLRKDTCGSQDGDLSPRHSCKSFSHKASFTERDAGMQLPAVASLDRLPSLLRSSNNRHSPVILSPTGSLTPPRTVARKSSFTTNNNSFTASIQRMVTARQSSGPSDCVWATGVLAYWMLTGHAPLNLSYSAALAAHNASSHHPQLTFPFEVGDEARDFICRCMSPDPLKRPSMAELSNHPWIRDLRRNSLQARPSMDMDARQTRCPPSRVTSYTFLGSQFSGRMTSPGTKSFHDSARSSARNDSANMTVDLMQHYSKIPTSSAQHDSR